MYDAKFIDIEGSVEFMDHHVDYFAPSVQPKSVLKEYVGDGGNVLGDGVYFGVVCIRVDCFVEAKMSS